MTPHIFDIFDTANQITDKEERAFYLRENQNAVIRSLIRMQINPDVSFELPEGTPPFMASPYDAIGNIYSEIGRIERVFLKGTLPGFPVTKREGLFIATLEYLDKDDARVLLAVKDKTLPKLFKNLKDAFMKEVFPELAVS